MFNIHGPCDIIDHIHPTTGYNDEGKEKCREKSEYFYYYLSPRSQSNNWKNFTKKEIERECVCAY